MKRVYIRAEIDVDLSNVLRKIKISEKRVGVFTTVQFEHEVKKIKDFVFCGSILGCNIENVLKVKDKVDALLFIGSGDFHPFALKKLKKPIYIANPLTNQFSKISEKELEKLEREQKGRLIRYLSAKKVGIIVSTKPGQNLFSQAVKLQEKIKKESFLFVCNDLDTNEFENFSDVDMWVNTACPRIEHKKIINMRDLPELK